MFPRDLVSSNGTAADLELLLLAVCLRDGADICCKICLASCTLRHLCAFETLALTLFMLQDNASR